MVAAAAIAAMDATDAARSGARANATRSASRRRSARHKATPSNRDANGNLAATARVIPRNSVRHVSRGRRVSRALLIRR